MMKNVLLKICIVGLALSFHSACTPGQDVRTTEPAIPAVESGAADAELTKQIAALCNDSQGEIGVTVIHVESGRTVNFEGEKKLPLYSVFKLPLALEVLKRVAEKKISLDQKIHVAPADVAPGSQFNADLWRKPADKTVAELLEFSIVRSDNTSSDQLLQLVGGPAVVTERMRTLGFPNIDIVSTVREYATSQGKPNLATTANLARLLSRLQKGELLEPSHLSLLLGFMERARTGGERRLRASLPLGTTVAEKTGSGADSTNDVGLITLPDGKGHLAMAVLIHNSKLTAEAQERLIADLARKAYDAFVTSAATVPGR
nr:ClassA_beta_lactamase [uncultured bacterium]